MTFTPDSYHNTTDSEDPDLAGYETKAQAQEKVILEWFEQHPHAACAPSQVNELMPDAPITSVRRAITNLTNFGKLLKTREQRMGPRKRPEYLWRLPEPVPVQKELFK